MRFAVAVLLTLFLLLGLAGAAWAADEESTAAEPAVAWLATELTDVSTGETFTLAEFAGTPVLLESFAVWCPICTNQQKQVRALHEEVGDEVISIALNTDPNEDRDKVAAHIARHGFDWRYAVAPAELILALKEEFGVGILNAPSAPMVLICGDQSVREMLKRGVKRPNFLQEQVAACAAPAT
jgi:cytochrome oxidase Cu insertion factor (SCO1/SenC/PrrC family)